MGGFVPTPEQYRMWMASRKPVEPSAPDESFPRKAGRVFRAGVDTAGNLAAGEARRLTDPVRKSAALVGEAAQEFSQGYSNEAEGPDYIGDYIKRNPGQSAQLMKGITTPYEPAPQTNVTAKAEAESQAADVERDKLLQSETARRTIREVIGANGKKTYTNQGNEGTVVMRNGESTGPDIGKPGRGGFSSGGDYEAYRRNLLGDAEYEAEKAGIEGNKAAQQLAQILQRNPFAREAIMAQIQGQQANERALMGRRYDAEMLGAEAELETERDAAYAEIDADKTLTPEQNMQAKAIADREIQLEGLRRGIKPRTTPLA